MHTICFDDAQRQWSKWKTLSPDEKKETLKLCVLSAILAIVVNFPFRSSTVMGLRVAGPRTDIVLSEKSAPRATLSVNPDIMKNLERYDAILTDTSDSQPVRILQWFMKGPRNEILYNNEISLTSKPDPTKLFCGITTADYRKTLTEWTFQKGMRMTTHTFRHAIASILVNLGGMSVEEVTRILGNRSVATARRHYVIYEGVRIRGDALNKIEDLRKSLKETKHPGRPRI